MKSIFSLLLSILFLWVYHYAQAEKANKKEKIDKRLEYRDLCYENTFRTVLLYPLLEMDNVLYRQLLSPIINLNEPTPLFLEFDNLGDTYESFRVKVYHCNADWTPSVLNEVEFLTEYNDFPIQDYKLSYTTKIPYIHYSFELPKTRISGNFLVVVYRDNNPKDFVISKRFMVAENRINIQATVNYSNGIEERRTHQQVDFELLYGNLPIRNPQEDFKIIIRQNQRWDITKTNFKVFNVNDFEKKITYNFINLENNFWAGNEFRFFDTRSLRTKMVKIDRIFYDPDQTKVQLFYDKPQFDKSYLETEDFDGNEIIDHYESHNGATEADYVAVRFLLVTEEKKELDIYVNGKFANWELTNANKMEYVPEMGAYRLITDLKQGIYNYNYSTKNKITGQINERILDGSHAQTTNNYEIFIYFRQPAGRADLLVGYKKLQNPR